MTTHTLKKDECIHVNELTITNVGVQTVITKNPDMKQTAVSICIQPDTGEGKNFFATIVQWGGTTEHSAETEQSRHIQAFGNDIQITSADSYESQDITFTIQKIIPSPSSINS